MLGPTSSNQSPTLGGSYKLPIGRAHTGGEGMNKVLDGVIGGWQVQTIIVLRSGVPYTPIISADRANTGVGGQRPNLNPNGGNPNFKRSLAPWFDNTRYVEPAPYTYGTVLANTLRSDMHRQYDASIFKNFAMTHQANLQFRAEFFNISNTTSFSAPGASITSSGSTTPVDTSTYGQITSTSIPSRDIQFALKLDF